MHSTQQLVKLGESSHASLANVRQIHLDFLAIMTGNTQGEHTSTGESTGGSTGQLGPSAAP